jgi:predicted flavoprotein YhiN
MIYDFAVIGGGPAGMIAACRASERGARVILLEKNKNLGLKLLMTGHGRCNITNIMADSREMISIYGCNGKFLFSAFNKFSTEDTLNFFSGLGVVFKEEANGRIFPQSGRAADVLKRMAWK